MNYLIFDTEKTYNYGYILVNDKQEVLLKRNLIIKNNFENRNLIGENTYNTKKKYYDNDPVARYVSSAEGANIIANDLSTNEIDYIIAHNCNEDKRQLELLHQQTGVSFPQIPFYDSINLVKLLFPNNTQTGLEAIVNDITNGSIQQTHTALQDCELLYTIISPILPCLGYFIEYREIFAHDNDYEITHKVLTNLDKILPLPKSTKEIQEILNIESRGDKTKLTNFFKKTSQSYSFWTFDGSMVNKSDNFEIVKALANLMASFEDIKELVTQSCSGYTSVKEDSSEKIEAYEKLMATYEYRLREYDKFLNDKIHEYNYQISNYEEEIRKLKEENAALRTARRRPRINSTAIEDAVIQKMIANFELLKHGGIFNRNTRRFKKALKKRDSKTLFELLNN